MDDARARELLARERARVERALAHLVDRESADELSHLDQHPAEQATELSDDELAEGRVEELREELTAIERAERRLRDGTYGLSVVSGMPIPDERLEAAPWADRMVEEQPPHAASR